jgi:hypothetical protein
MTDTPIQPVASPPVARSEQIKAFIGDLARPFAIIATSFAASWATITVSYRVSDGNDGAIFIGAVYAGVGALYGFKAWERRKESEKAAEIAIAQTGAVSPEQR